MLGGAAQHTSDVPRQHYASTGGTRRRQHRRVVDHKRQQDGSKRTVLRGRLNDGVDGLVGQAVANVAAQRVKDVSDQHGTRWARRPRREDSRQDDGGALGVLLEADLRKDLHATKQESYSKCSSSAFWWLWRGERREGAHLGRSVKLDDHRRAVLQGAAQSNTHPTPGQLRITKRRHSMTCIECEPERVVHREALLLGERLHRRDTARHPLQAVSPARTHAATIVSSKPHKLSSERSRKTHQQRGRHFDVHRADAQLARVHHTDQVVIATLRVHANHERQEAEQNNSITDACGRIAKRCAVNLSSPPHRRRWAGQRRRPRRCWTPAESNGR